jgi:hypothetical protein
LIFSVVSPVGTALPNIGQRIIISDMMYSKFGCYRVAASFQVEKKKRSTLRHCAKFPIGNFNGRGL